MQTGITKRALIRDEGYPVGQPAPCHVNCGCGTAVPIVGNNNPCPICGCIYSATGWILNGQDVQAIDEVFSNMRIRLPRGTK